MTSDACKEKFFLVVINNIINIIIPRIYDDRRRSYKILRRRRRRRLVFLPSSTLSLLSARKNVHKFGTFIELDEPCIGTIRFSKFSF